MPSPAYGRRKSVRPPLWNASAAWAGSERARFRAPERRGQSRTPTLVETGTRAFARSCRHPLSERQGRADLFGAWALLAIQVSQGPGDAQATVCSPAAQRATVLCPVQQLRRIRREGELASQGRAGDLRVRAPAVGLPAVGRPVASLQDPGADRFRRFRGSG